MTEEEFRTLVTGDRVTHARGGTWLVTGWNGHGELAAIPETEPEKSELGLQFFFVPDNLTKVKPDRSSHYSRLGQFETKHVIRAWQETWPPEWRYFLGSGLKYLSRLGAKPGQDVKVELQKAIDFLQMALETPTAAETELEKK